jgi:hypothetical protein
VTINVAQQRYISWVSEVLVDIVVLNLFVEFVHTVVIDSFWISILTAILLKLMVDGVKGLEQRVSAYFATKEGTGWKVGRFVAVWLIMFLSKFVILEAVNIVFGDHVQLGSFFEILGIVLVMLVSSAALHAVFRWLGRVGGDSSQAPAAD